VPKRLYLLLCAVICLRAAPGPPTLRLPDTVRPTRYAAELTLLTDATAFSGRIAIDVELREPANIVWLNASELSIHAAAIVIGPVTHQAKVIPGGTDFVGLSLPTAIPAGRAKLVIDYEGKISSKSSSGIFQSRDADNLYLFTQFEAIDARRAFPCFDEPSFKTPWQMTLHVRAADIALANTPQVSESPEPGGMKKVVFAPTKPLPSYLVAFAAGPFELVDAGVAGVNRVPVRIVTPKGKRNQAKYAVEVTGTIVQKLEDYFGIPYPYEKLDCIAIPLTFGFGAMENAGLETYAQGIVLSDPKTDTEERQRRYASIAAHELAHQWFGDLVTTAWWDDIWLNEAFATWMSSKIIAAWHPEWTSRLTDLKSKFDVMQVDSLASTRNIHQGIQSNDDIGNAFDSITYQKGAAVIRMFENWDGEKQFRAGVQSYLKQYAFKNARSADFLDSISGAGKSGLTTAFATFLNQPGVPEISVALKCDGAPAVRLSQKYYRPIGAAASQEETWKVPVCVRYQAGRAIAQECFLLDKPSAEFKLTKAAGCPASLTANDSASGYYTVNYEDKLRENLLARGSTFLNAAERQTFLNDLQLLAAAGDLTEDKTLAAIPVFASAPERQIVEKAEEITAGARSLIAPELRPNYARFVRTAFGTRAAQLGWTPKAGETAETNLLRAKLLPFVAQQGEDAALRAEARRLAEGWLRDRRGVDPNLLDGVLRTASYSGNQPLFDAFLRELKKTSDLADRRSIITALGTFQDPALAREALGLMLDPSLDMRESQSVLLNDEHPAAVLAFVKQNYDALIERSPGGGSFQFGARLPGVGAGLCDEASRKEYEDFFGSRAKNFTGGTRIFDQTLESIRICEAQKSARGASAAAFFAKQ
jgi:alanyl aminopeptidase